MLVMNVLWLLLAAVQPSRAVYNQWKCKGGHGQLVTMPLQGT